MLEPFDYQFMVRAMAAAALVGALTGAVGVYVVLRRLSYIGHGLAHSVFGGAVVSFVSGVNFYVGSTLWGALSVLLINGAARRRQISGDAAIGIVSTSAFALGVLLISQRRTFTRDFEAALFGEILGIDRTDLWVLAGAAALVVVTVFLFWKPLLFLTFDPEVARASGVPVAGMEAVFSLVLAAAVIASLQVLGVTLLAAALVIPPVTARLVTDSFPRLFALSVTVGAVTGFLGAYLSWYVDSSSGATIVLGQAALFVVVLAWAVGRSRWLRREARQTERLTGLERALYD